jgi:hypothetical protein
MNGQASAHSRVVIRDPPASRRVVIRDPSASRRVVIRDPSSLPRRAVLGMVDDEDAARSVAALRGATHENDHAVDDDVGGAARRLRR